jgi:hypothetical protein
MSINGLVRRANSLLSAVVRRRRSRGRAELQLVRASGLFDADWYCREYPDVQSAGIDPLRHYMSMGWREGRDPGPEFSSLAYLRANADVARTGNNPLVHFIEFGHSEGRESFGHRPSNGECPLRTFDFPDPAPCFSAPPPAVVATSWLRHEELSGHGVPCFIGDEPAGIAADADTARALQEAWARVLALSGDEEHARYIDDRALPGGDERLVDAWFVNSARLRTRWAVDRRPFVIRAYQADTLKAGAVRRVAEGLVGSPLDLFDLHLANAYFPVLLVFAEPNGTIRGARILAFPSLCRGGPHYPELLDAAAAEAGNLDPLTRGETLATRLSGLLSGRDRPAVTDLLVNVAGADGAGPLFQPDFQAWLGKVARIAVLPRGDGGISAPAPYLAAAATVEPRSPRAGSGSTLILRHDMIPTIALLAEAVASDGASQPQTLLPLLIAGADPAQPAISIALPDEMIPVLDANLGHGASQWPRLQGGGIGSRGVSFPAGAIRAGRGKALADAELFFPISGDVLPETGPRPAITWLVECHRVDEARLIEALESAALQCGAWADGVALIGRTTSGVLDCAARGFGDRVGRHPDMDSALRALNTVLCGYIGAGVILHDNRCASALAALLEFDPVHTASCVLIAVEPRGKALHAAVTHGGMLAGRNGTLLSTQDGIRAAEQLWRAVYPVVGPSPPFWLAKSDRVTTRAGDKGRQGRSDGVHLCSAIVTASLLGGQSLPPAVDGVIARSRAIQAAVLFG